MERESMAETEIGFEGDDATGSYRIFLRGLEVRCSIGVHAHERAGTQRVTVDLDLRVTADGGPLDDSLARVVDYERIVDGVRRLAAGQHVNLVETLAERIAEFCLAEARVRRVRVAVAKPDAFADVAAVGIEIDRSSKNGRS